MLSSKTNFTSIDEAEGANVNEMMDKGEGQYEQVEKITESKKYFIPYPKTNGFAWNNRGQLVYFACQKYNFKFIQSNRL